MEEENTPSQVIEEGFNAWRIQRIHQGGNNISLRMYAEYLGVKQPILSMWLSKKRKPNIASLIQIAPKLEELLGPTVYDQLGIRPLGIKEDHVLREIREKYYTLPPERRHELLPLIEKFMEEQGFRKVDEG